LQASVQLQAGSGPRHMAFHPSLPVAFVADEGSGNATRLTVCQFDGKTGRERHERRKRGVSAF